MSSRLGRVKAGEKESAPICPLEVCGEVDSKDIFLIDGHQLVILDKQRTKLWFILGKRYESVKILTDH